MISEKPGGRVLLADQRPASAVLHSVLAHAVRTFPDAMAEVELPAGAEAFRREYPECLPGFEAARAGSRRRTEIARAAVAELQRHLIWQGPEGMRPLGEALTLPAEPLSLDVHEFTGEPGWEPGLTYRGERWPGSRLPALADDLVSRGMATGDAGSALTWVASECLEGGRLYLPRRKIAVLGAGAEMAPTRFWLEAGAEVLWLDVVPPPAAWRDVPGMAGRLHWPAAGVDLLARPQEVLATLMAFADGEPVDLGLFAYAPGQARELLLTGVMNEIVNALPRPLLRTVTLLVSPTTPTALTAEDQPAIEARRENRPGWEVVLDRLGLLGRGGGSASVGGGTATRTVVGIQGASYQAAQYLGKVLVAECWANDVANASLRISANTAAITRTRSLNHPVFAAAFGGAAAFKVETLTPGFSRRLNGLLAVRDWFCPEPSTPGRVRIHGGIHTLPYPLDPALRVAAAMGFARSPKLLGGLIRR